MACRWAWLDPRPLLVAFAAVLIVALWWTFWIGQRDREAREIEAVARANSNLAGTLEQHTLRTLEAAEQLVSLAGEQWLRQGDAFDADAFLKAARVDPDVVLSMLVIDAAGRIRHATGGIAHADVSHRDYFRRAINDPLGRVQVTPTFFGTLKPRWVMPVSRRIERPDGSLAGVVFVALDPDHFADLYRRIDLGRHGLVSVIGRDGYVRARMAGGTATPAQDISGTPIYREAWTGDGKAVVLPCSVDGIRRVIGYRRLDEYDVALIVGSAESEAVARSHAAAWLVPVAAVATLFIAAFTFWVIVLLSRQRQSASRIDGVRKQQEALLDSIADAAWLKDAGGRYTAVNRAFEVMFAVRAADIIGRRTPEVFGDADPTAMQDVREDEDVARTAIPARREYVLGSPEAGRWIETIKVPIFGREGVVSGTAGTARDLTRRKRLEEALRDSEERLRLAMRHANIGMWDWDLDTGRMVCTERTDELLGIDAQGARILREQYLSRVRPEDMPRIRQAVERCLDEGSAYDVEYRVQRPDGTCVWLHDRGGLVGVLSAGGRRMLGIVEDVTSRYRAEEDLRASEAQFRTIFDRSAFGMLVIGPDGRRLRENAALAAMLGYAPGELRRLGGGAFSDPEDRIVTLAMMERALEGDFESFHLEKRYVRKDGATVWTLFSATLVRDANGAPLHFVAQLVDITARKMAELALRDAEKRFRLFVENMHEVFWMASPDLSRIDYVSPACERLFGIPPQRMLGAPGQWRTLLDPRDADTVDAFIGAQCERRNAECEVRMRRPDGETRWILVRSIPWIGADGIPVAMGSVTDITARKQEEEDRVREAERQRDTLVREVHHRIKNNLQGVVGLVAQHVRAHPAAEDVLNRVAGQINSIAAVHGLQGMVGESSVDVLGLLRSIVDALAALGGTRVEVRGPSPPPPLPRLRERESVPIALIVNELVWNAIKHARRDLGHPVVGFESLGDTLRIVVENPAAAGAAERMRLSNSRSRGLGLVRALMPSRGATLVFEECAETVTASLTLQIAVLFEQGRRLAGPGSRAEATADELPLRGAA